MYIILLIKSEKKNQKYEQSKGEKAGAGDWFPTFFFLSVLNTGRIAKYVPRLRNKWFLEERFYFQNANFAQRILKTCFDK